MADGKIDVTTGSNGKSESDLNELKLALDTLGLIRGAAYELLTKDGLAAANKYVKDVVDKEYILIPEKDKPFFIEDVAAINHDRMYEESHIQSLSDALREQRGDQKPGVFPAELFPEVDTLYKTLSEANLKRNLTDRAFKTNLRRSSDYDIRNVKNSLEKGIIIFHGRQTIDRLEVSGENPLKKALSKAVEDKPVEPPIGQDQEREQE